MPTAITFRWASVIQVGNSPFPDGTGSRLLLKQHRQYIVDAALFNDQCLSEEIWKIGVEEFNIGY